MQLGGAEPGRDGFEADTAEGQVHHGGVGPQGDLASGVNGAEPELLSADGQVARCRNCPGHLDSNTRRNCWSRSGPCQRRSGHGVFLDCCGQRRRHLQRDAVTVVGPEPGGGERHLK